MEAERKEMEGWSEVSRSEEIKERYFARSMKVEHKAKKSRYFARSNNLRRWHMNCKITQS